MYPDSCGPPNKFHTRRTVISLFPRTSIHDILTAPTAQVRRQSPDSLPQEKILVGGSGLWSRGWPAVDNL